MASAAKLGFAALTTSLRIRSPPAFYDDLFVKPAAVIRSSVQVGDSKNAGCKLSVTLSWAPWCHTTFYPSALGRPTYSCMRAIDAQVTSIQRTPSTRGGHRFWATRLAGGLVCLRLGVQMPPSC